MKEPFVFLCHEITRENALSLIRWLQDGEVRKFLSDTQGVLDSIQQVIDRVNLPGLTHLFSQNCRFYMIRCRQNTPVGFVRLIINGDEIEIVITIGDQSNWGKKHGSGALRESMKIAFFELRTSKLIANIHRENKRSIRAFLSAGFRIERETPSTKCYAITMESYLKNIQRRDIMSGKITITQIDLTRLRKLISDELCKNPKLNKFFQDLDCEISRADVVDTSQIAGDIVTMRSKALLNLDGEDMEVSLVYPDEADFEMNKLSILSPVGTAILGYGEGDKIEWEVPSGTAEIQIKKILYQPEAAGDYHL